MDAPPDAGRSLAFIDAVFAVALTLLATTLETNPEAWASWSRWWDTVGAQLVAFGISFLLVASYWWANRRFVASLRHLSDRVVVVTLTLLAFVVLIPFTTNALGDTVEGADVLTTVVYAINIAVVSCLEIVLYEVARAEGLFRTAPDAARRRRDLVNLAAVPAVFLASIPVTLLVSPELGRWSWIALAVIGPVVGNRRHCEPALS
jgi:uncharacterized membrane protein